MFKTRQTKDSQSLESRHEGILQQCTAWGKTAGLKGIPKAGETVIHYFNPIAARYRELLTTFSPVIGNQESIAELQRKASEEKQRLSTERLRILNNKLLQLNNQKDAMPDAYVDGKGQFWVHGLVFCAALCEAGYTVKSIALLEGGSNLVRLVSFVILTAIFMGVPHILLKIYRSTQSHPYRLVIWGVVGLFILAAFIGLSVMRTAYVEHLGLTTLDAPSAESKVTVHPVFFLIVQIFLLAVSTFAASFLVTPEEKKGVSDAKKLDAAIEATEREIRRIETEMSAIPERAMYAEISRHESASQSKVMASRIQALYEQGIAAYVEANTMYRNDDYTIDASKQIPEL